MQAQMDDESNQRLREIGIGMLRSESPNFFAALGQGLEAAETGSRSRMDRLRQIAEAERQQRALEGQEAGRVAEEQYRQESLRLRREEAARANRPQYTVVGTDADGSAIVVDMRDPTRTQVLRGVTPLQVAAQSIRSDAATLNRATAAGNKAISDEVKRRTEIGNTAPLTTEERNRIFQEAFERTRRAPAGETSTETTTTAPAPSQVLQYGGPRINPQRQP
jgi:hypothetical protein